MASTLHQVSEASDLFLLLVDAFPLQKQDVQTLNQSMSGPARTGQTSAHRFQPYRMSRARETEYQNTEAVPSAAMLSEVPFAGSSIPQATGGSIPETTADATNEQPTTEGEEAPVSSYYCSHPPHVTG